MAKKVKKYNGTKTLEVLEGADKYNLWIATQIRKFAIPPILEFGSGTGNITQNIIDLKPFVVSEVDPELVIRLKGSFKNIKNVEVVELDISIKPKREFHDRFNTVFSSNVLEHISDDLAALKNLKKTLRNNGRIILVVPAKKVAYGRLDKQLGHYRRYEKQELKELLEKAGFEIEEIYYFNIVGLLAWKVRDYVTKNTELKSSQVKYFDSIVPVLRKIESLIKPPIGISLVVVAKNSE